MDSLSRLGEYLRARRALVTPDQVGLPTQSNRRVTGLRREEVALLSGISADYYLRLERGRDTNPSAQVLEAVARALQLDEHETEYLLSLIAPTIKKPRAHRTPRVPARLNHLLATIDLPAFIEDRHFDVLAANPAATALSPRIVPGQNRLRSLLLDPEEKEFHDNWDAAVTGMIASFRQSVAQHAHDARTVELVGELSLASGRFRKAWARHDVKPLIGGAAAVHHPVVGDLHLYREKLHTDGLILVIYWPEPATADAEKLQLLNALATSNSAVTSPSDPAATSPSGRAAGSAAGGAGATEAHQAGLSGADDPSSERT